MAQEPVLESPDAPIGILPPLAVQQVLLWDQTAPCNITGFSSQNWTDAGGICDTFDDRAADDFLNPGPFPWSIETVNVLGVYAATTIVNAQSVNVTFFNNAAGLPGAVVPGCNFQGIIPVDLSNPSFSINLPSPCILSPGTYWVSVQANQPGGACSTNQWFWAIAVFTNLNTAAWENPGNGFGTGCTTFAPVSTCFGLPTPDIADVCFQIIGEEVIPEGACCDVGTGICNDMVDETNCQSPNDTFFPNELCSDIRCTPPSIPTLTQWGMIIMAGVLGLFAVIGLFVMRRSGAVKPSS